ncbi:MAG: prepilin-type N-terminal cleavage/methylation domain-containing protein [Candidatus Omnitrophica bacterium]|nr:prepilin-type N-terminal cleavage/methylation domain-containing protein [Candidatus Omnitrophota bacterium]
MRKKKNNKGLTLIELIIVSLTMAIVALAVYSTLSNGLKIWQRIDHGRQEEDVGIFFEKLTSDLRNGIPYKAIIFSGREDEFELPTLVTSQRLKSRTVGKVRYSYDQDKRIIKRYLMDFSDVYDSGSGAAQELLPDVRSLKFQYYVYEAGSKQYLWHDEWATTQTEQMPLAVRVELEIGRDDKVSKFAKTVEIPVSN